MLYIVRMHIYLYILFVAPLGLVTVCPSQHHVPLSRSGNDSVRAISVPIFIYKQSNWHRLTHMV